MTYFKLDNSSAPAGIYYTTTNTTSTITPLYYDYYGNESWMPLYLYADQIYPLPKIPLPKIPLSLDEEIKAMEEEVIGLQEKIRLFKKIKNESTTPVVSEQKQAIVRISARKLNKIIYDQIISYFKGKNLGEEKTQNFINLLNTEYGRGFISYLMGLLIGEFNKKNAIIQLLAQELRAEGIANGLEEIISSLLSNSESILSLLEQEEVQVEEKIKEINNE